MPNVTALIADDEQLMRANLREMLALRWPELEIVAEAPTATRRRALREHRPDVAFLDIRMPGAPVSMRRSRSSEHSRIVFVTAYEQHALAAFDAGAVDYLLKPIDEERLAQAVERISRNLRKPPADIEGLLADLRRTIKPADARYMRWIKASVGRELRLLSIDDVVYFQSDTKYTRVVLAQAEALIRTPLKELLSELDPEKFWQIHRGTLVNVAAIASVSRDGPKSSRSICGGGPKRLPVSRQFFHLFRQM
jgi:DNA-binding LytR/AlgR family response regulator